jgi:hypothetical protein
MTSTAVRQLNRSEARLLDLMAASNGEPTHEVFDAARHLLGAARDELDTITSTPDGVVVRMAPPPVPPDWHNRSSHAPEAEPPRGLQVEYIVVPADRPDADGEVGLMLLTPLPRSPMHIFRRTNPALSKFYLEAEPIFGRVVGAARELEEVRSRAAVAGAFGATGAPPAVGMLDEIVGWIEGTFPHLVELARAQA